MTIERLIINRIHAEGPISFHDFMDMALYYPGLGYYTRDRENIGTAGDYYTSPHLSPLFAGMLAKQIEEMWICLDKKPFTIVEFGAGNGVLCAALLRALEKNEPLYEQLRYFIIEKRLRKEQAETLPVGKVRWLDDIHDMPETEGCILSNELVDNFPVHQVIMRENLMEVFVDYNEGFEEKLRPASCNLRQYLDQMDTNLPAGYRSEINLDTSEWIGETAKKLFRGFVLTIDYGYTNQEFYKPSRNRGTLVCYHGHTVNENPYINIGLQDITTHVNFTALQQAGEKFGLVTCGYTDQARFLSALGITGHLKSLEESEGFNKLENNQVNFVAKTLMIDMGRKFKVLIQQKNLGETALSGLTFKLPLC